MPSMKDMNSAGGFELLALRRREPGVKFGGDRPSVPELQMTIEQLKAERDKAIELASSFGLQLAERNCDLAAANEKLAKLQDHEQRAIKAEARVEALEYKLALAVKVIDACKFGSVKVERVEKSDGLAAQLIERKVQEIEQQYRDNFGLYKLLTPEEASQLKNGCKVSVVGSVKALGPAEFLPDLPKGNAWVRAGDLMVLKPYQRRAHRLGVHNDRCLECGMTGLEVLMIGGPHDCKGGQKDGA